MFRTLASLSLLVVLFVGCDDSYGTPSANQQAQTADPNSTIAVTATVGMVGDLVRTIGGDRVDVTQICGSGVDPHLYKATRDDVQAMMSADLIVYSGLMLEGKMTDTLIKMARHKPVIAVTEAIDETMLLEPDDFAGHYDPHVWMDVAAWSQCVDVIADELSAFDPLFEPAYRERAHALREKLADLDEYGKSVIATIPEGGRILVTSHDAFGYFGRAYGLKVLGIQGISTDSEAGLQRINTLVDLLVEQNVKSVFVESSVPRKSVDSLVEGAKSRGHHVSVGEKELFSDAMGESGTYEGTYIGMLDHNLTVVARGLGGEAPADGFQGKLSE
ncbi:MAG: metal ABC transporter solute-binding protein, Zn/Mn family [Rhodopirellula sp. JB055]|uniref:metal ABC transporter solute-binding protein, Zn/Mn family n=1 Tax=Rhodopirellula sp. JB055 TaxID=3342846 RepID=UPI00370CAA5D